MTSRSTESSPESRPTLVAWVEALPRVLGLLDTHRRDLFRHELQRFIATSRFDPSGADDNSSRLREMLLQAARASRQPAAINATRALSNSGELVELCEALLAAWLDAVDAIDSSGGQPCDPTGMNGEVFFGPRLGGPGRAGAKTASRNDSENETTESLEVDRS